MQRAVCSPIISSYLSVYNVGFFAKYVLSGQVFRSITQNGPSLHSRSGLLSDKPSSDVKSLQRVRRFFACHGTCSYRKTPQVLGILVTRATERASFHYGHAEQLMQERLDVSRITLADLQVAH